MNAGKAPMRIRSTVPRQIHNPNATSSELPTQPTHLRLTNANSGSRQLLRTKTQMLDQKPRRTRREKEQNIDHQSSPQSNWLALTSKPPPQCRQTNNTSDKRFRKCRRSLNSHMKSRREQRGWSEEPLSPPKAVERREKRVMAEATIESF